MFDLLTLLADGAAPTTATAVAHAGWLSEEGIAAIVSIVLAVLSALKAVLAGMGRQAEAAKVAAASQSIEKGAATVGALVDAIGQLRRSGKIDPVAMNELLARIKTTTSDLNVGAMLHAVVESEKAAPAKQDELPTTAVEAARAALAPAVPTPPGLLRRLTGRLS